MNKLTPDQAKALCDWLAALDGGYGHVTTCEGGATSKVAPHDQASCAAAIVQENTQGRYANCPLTVAQYQTCLQWRQDNLCNPSPGPAPDACSVLSGPACS